MSDGYQLVYCLTGFGRLAGDAMIFLAGLDGFKLDLKKALLLPWRGVGGLWTGLGKGMGASGQGEDSASGGWRALLTGWTNEV